MRRVSEILLGHHGLAGVQALLVGSPMQEILRDTLYTLLDGAGQLRACHLQRAKFKPGRKLTAYYDLHLLPQRGTGDCIRPIAVTWTRPEVAPNPGQQGDDSPFESGVLPPELANPFRRLTTTAPDWGMTIQVSPLDSRYPQLPRLSDPHYVRDLLATYAAPTACDYAITSIRYRPGQRHVLRYDPVAAAAPAHGPGTVFAKLYPDASRQHLCMLTHQVADWLATFTPEATALRPQAYVAEDTTILYPWVDGDPLSQHRRSPTRHLASCLTQTGVALRALHAAPTTVTQGLPSHDFAAEIRAIAKTCEHIQVLLPAVGQTIHALLERAKDVYATLPQEAPTFIHGDFKADHVLVAPRSAWRDSRPKLTLIDFDSCAQADPALDVGKFLADLAWLFARSNPPGLVQAQNDFLAGYNLDSEHPRLLRARIVEALILIKITAHRVPLFGPDWPAQTTAMIDRAVTMLEPIAK